MPRRYPRLTRSELLSRLRGHAAEHGFVTWESLHEHDPIAERSVMLHFHGLSDARHAAGVRGSSRKNATRADAKTAAPGKKWSRERVVAELRRLHRQGQHTALADLVEAGHLSLIHAARKHAGGLEKARALAGIPKSSGRKKGHSQPHTKDSIIREIRQRNRMHLPLASSQVPQHLYSAARWQFGSWPNAIAAARINPPDYRPKPRPYTRKQIINVLREAAASGFDLTKANIERVISMDAVRRVFSTLDDALLAAGLRERLAQRRHGAKLWDRERLIQTLRERAARGEHTLTPGLFRAVALHFGGAAKARRAAGVPSPVDVRVAERRKAQMAIKITERVRRRLRYE